MHSDDDGDLSSFRWESQSHSHLLSESPLVVPSSSSSSASPSWRRRQDAPKTGPDGTDLSLSELSLYDRTIQANSRPFSLLKRDDSLLHSSSSSFSRSQDDDAGEEISGRRPEDEDGQEEVVDEEDVDPEKMQRLRAKAREEKLQNDLFILRKINAAFASYNDALSETGSANQRIAAQLAETDALLNKYVGILSKSEEYAKLIFDEEFEGAEADERTLEEERAAEYERRRKEQERALAEKLEQERKQREEEERLHRAELERLEQAKKQKAGTRGGVAGVRGTRASMRGAARGVTSGMTRSASTRGRPSPPVSSASSSRLPTATAGTRGRVRVTRQT